MEDLKVLRSQIDEVDRDLSALLEKRMKIVEKIGETKLKNNIPVIDHSRASLVVEKAVERLEDKKYNGEVAQIFTNIISVSEGMQKAMVTKASGDHDYLSDMLKSAKPKKELSKDIKVVYQGVPGSFAEAALNQYFGKDTTTTRNVEEFEDVFKALNNNEADYGVLPIENSQTGSIAEVYDLFRKYRCFIVGETSVLATQNLLGIKGAKLSDIKTIYSHQQGFLQTKEFLKKYKEIETVLMSNTAISAQYISEQKDISKGAIASSVAAEKYGLDILEESINTDKNNTTRFIIIAPNPEIEDNSSKISMSFTLPNVSGALSRILLIFAKNDLNMLKIESRPIANKKFEYFFYADISGNMKEEKVQRALSEISLAASYFEVLGNY